ncbi:FAD-binding protein [Erythrobacter aurantius]|uniref:FAD-binding protein n=1 Tax=Erythrobacter aurantius TaxID=2909249 RepID=UPI00207A37C2|nr:FAD-binding protein [Erythrobacter aurantius]
MGKRLKPGDPHWHSRVGAPACLGEDVEIAWDDAADIVIVGLGGAGVCAAIEALDAGASVIAVDRFAGGGATRMSGGVFYAGGGTQQQREANVDDDPENMFAYLQQEVGDAVPAETLMDFCQTSVEQSEWLQRNGVEFASTVCPIKTSYPPDGYYLYFSGNEAQVTYAKQATPAQRGHRTFGKGLTGHRFYDALLRSALAKGLRVYRFSDAQRILLSSNGTIEGIETKTVDPASKAARELEKLNERFGSSRALLFPSVAAKLKSRADRISRENAVARSIRANRAVILTAGGFVHNREMVAHHAPAYSGAIALGSIGCDGSGIRLGQSAGAAVDRLDNISAWRQFQPPRALATGIVVDAQGKRFVAEDCYGGTIGHAIAQEADGRAYIIVDHLLWKSALRQALPGKGKLFRLQGAPTLMGMLLGSKKGRTLSELAEKCGMDPATLIDAVGHYNRASAGDETARFPKHADFTGQIVGAPFHAIDISIANKRYLCPSISLGGITVDTRSGQALDADGQPIAKLFAAGKNAVGISSHRYVSGISLADCVYSGRIAGRSAVRMINV